MVRIRPRLRKLGVVFGYYNGKEKWPGNKSELKNKLCFYMTIIFVYCGNLKVLVLMKLWKN